MSFKKADARSFMLTSAFFLEREVREKSQMGVLTNS
jgi:hypothetical protein